MARVHAKDHLMIGSFRLMRSSSGCSGEFPREKKPRQSKIVQDIVHRRKSRSSTVPGELGTTESGQSSEKLGQRPGQLQNEAELRLVWPDEVPAGADAAVGAKLRFAVPRLSDRHGLSGVCQRRLLPVLSRLNHGMFQL